LEAAGITSALQQRAVVQLVRDLKKAQLWTKMKAVYPFVGGTATTHKWNLKDPQDTNGAFRLTFNGGWTHDSNGIDGNGSNAWADTYFVPDTQFSSGSASSVVTVAQDAAIAGADYASFNSGSTAGFGFLSRWSNNLANDPTIFDGVSDIYRSSTNRVTFDNANAIGTYVTSRTSTTVHKVYKNGSQVGSTNTGTEADKSLVTASIGVCVINRPNGNRTGYTSRQLRFLGFGSGLTDAEALLITNVVTHYQKTLGRSL
jgi:hypothetical protein